MAVKASTDVVVPCVQAFRVGDLNEAQRPAERDMWFFIWYWNIAQSASTTVVQDAVLAESLLVDELFFPRTSDTHAEKHGCIL